MYALYNYIKLILILNEQTSEQKKVSRGIIIINKL
jgi:hypothetical protein